MIRNIFRGVLNILGLDKQNRNIAQVKGRTFIPDNTVHIGNSKMSNTKNVVYFINKKLRNRKRNRIAKNSRRLNKLSMG